LNSVGVLGANPPMDRLGVAEAKHNDRTRKRGPQICDPLYLE
ncbi:MAG: hypothetical protein ACI9U6_003649, partial [Loktanella salsilacus]